MCQINSKTKNQQKHMEELGWLHTRGYWIGGLSLFARIAQSARLQWMF